LGNFDRLKIPPIAFNRQGLPLLHHFFARVADGAMLPRAKGIPSKVHKYLYFQIFLETPGRSPSLRQTFLTAKDVSKEKIAAPTNSDNGRRS
jgi:hypothetical protein